jgi:hypothetical protein
MLLEARTIYCVTRRRRKMKRWIVVIDWIDGDVEDSDELTVLARSEAEAVTAAVESWVESNEWPSCALQGVSVFSPKRLRGLA